MLYVAVNSQMKPSRNGGHVSPFISRTVDGRELPVHAGPDDCRGRALGILARLGVLIPRPEGLETTPFQE